MAFEAKLSHDALASDLANSLRTESVMTWCDVQLGPAGSPRPDVYTIKKSYMSPCPTAYECKVSQSDFRSDVTSGKWQSYLKYAGAVYFACEEGLIKPKNVPEHCGLKVRYPSGVWRAVKRAVLNPVTIPKETWLKLLIDGVEREGPRYRYRAYDGYKQAEAARKKFGELVGKTIKDRESMEHEICSAKYQAERILQDAQSRAESIRKEAAMAPLRAELCEALGLPENTDRWHIQHRVKKLKAALAEHPSIEAHRIITAQLQSMLQRYGWKDDGSNQESPSE